MHKVKKASLKLEEPFETPVNTGKLSDKLSEILEKHASVLNETERHHEANIRPELIGALQNTKESKLQEGRWLLEYRVLYKGKRLWTVIAEDLEKVMGYSSRTIGRRIDAYEMSQGKKVKPATKRAEGEHETEAQRAEDKFRTARALIRKAFRGYPFSHLDLVIAAVISAEARAWGFAEAFFMNIEPVAVSQQHESSLFVLQPSEDTAEDGDEHEDDDSMGLKEAA